MQLTTKGRFAVTAMMDITLHGRYNPVTLARISERQKISLSYLEQLFGKLRRNKLVDSVRGPGGGYKLAKPMHQVSAVDIILAVDEPIDATQCGGKENCHNGKQCMTHHLWSGLNVKIRDYLAFVTLEQLVTDSKAKNIAALQDLRDCGRSESF